MRNFDINPKDSTELLVIVKDKYWHKPNITLSELPRILEENQLHIYEHKRIPKKYMPTLLEHLRGWILYIRSWKNDPNFWLYIFGVLVAMPSICVLTYCYWPQRRFKKVHSE